MVADSSSWAVELDKQMESWQKDPAWVDSDPTVEVMQPHSGRLQLDTTGILALPPDALFTSLCDPTNKRIFKHLQEVKYRKILKELESGDQEVEVEFVNRWRFLFLSGSYSLTLRICPDRSNYKIEFELTKLGFMRECRGYWKLEPHAVPSSMPAASDSRSPRAADGGTDRDSGARVATRVRLVQEVEPSLKPPPLFLRYISSIAGKSMIDVFRDLQMEAARMRHGLPEDCDAREELGRAGYHCRGNTRKGG